MKRLAFARPGLRFLLPAMLLLVFFASPAQMDTRNAKATASLMLSETGDSNLHLRDALLRIKKTYGVDILFDDDLVRDIMVSTVGAWTKSANAEEALKTLLK